MKITSLEMYTKIKASGLLGKMRLLVYEILCRHNHSQYNGHKGLTAYEMRHIASTVFMITNTEHLPKRLSELEAMGCIEGIGTRQCRRSYHLATEWAINGKMPTKLVAEKKPAPKKERAVEMLRVLWKHSTKQDDTQWKKLANLIKTI